MRLMIMRQGRNRFGLLPAFLCVDKAEFICYANTTIDVAMIIVATAAVVLPVVAVVQEIGGGGFL